MNSLILVWNYLKARPLNTGLNVLLLALGIAGITILLLLNRQLKENIEANAKGIDLVVGAKGSPLQLILSTIFHADFPTGNISLAEAERLKPGRLIKETIPISLGDSYRGYRIAGTTRAYVQLYEASLAGGAWWENEMEVTLGHNVFVALNLQVGDRFTSDHGLMEGGEAHEGHEFVVTGILEPTGTVLDNLIVTSVESIWAVHDIVPVGSGSQTDTAVHMTTDHDRVATQHDHGEGSSSELVPSVGAGDSTLEITALLIRYRSPMAAIQLPRIVNQQTSMQAASPAFETARLYSILGVGLDILRTFAFGLILVSALSIFIALYNSLKERKYDLAIMRSMGAGRGRVFFSVLLEGILLTATGAITGVFLGHAILAILPALLNGADALSLDGSTVYPEEGIILAGSLVLGSVCALLPAIEAYQTDISKVLSESK